MAHHDPTNTKGGIADLLRRLGDDVSALVRNEIALAKLEVREAMQMLMRDSAKLGVAFTLAWLGALALTAALIIGVAHLIGDRYGFAALIVGVLFLAVGGLLARSGVKRIGSGALKPAATMRSLEENRDWASQELRDLRQELARRGDAASALPASPTEHAERKQIS